MRWWDRLRRSNFMIKLRSWEYWPFGIIHFPAIVYYGWLSLRARTFLFFSATNPGIPMGGMFGESKFDVLKKIPTRYTPKTILIKLPATAGDVVEAMRQHAFHFPVIFKPDIGERGFMVKRITQEDDIVSYLRQVNVDFLVQELVDLPLEFGVFYSRHPQEQHGKVTSVVMKEMLTVTGDGQSTLQDLILQKDRAKLQWNILQHTFHGRLTEVLETGRTMPRF